MILYYTGTGNSAYAAEYISNNIGDEIVNLFDRIKNNDYSEIYSEKPFVVAAPTYCWQIPHILRDWLLKAKLTGSRSIYFVMTCGGDIGNAEKYLKRLCTQINMKYMGCAEIVMPENYIAMFEVPDTDEAERIILNAAESLNTATDRIKRNEPLDVIKVSLNGRLMSSVVNDMFYPLFVKDKQFYATDDCIGCGLCESKCVMSNIRIVNGRPEWQGNCTHCMACICYCPREAIEYGRHSRGKPRYKCPEYNN